MENRARDLLGKNLLDPNSMQLRGVREGRREKGKHTICGEVNAKNAMGGYVGFRPFLISDSWASIEGEPQEELTLGYTTWRSRLAEICGSADDVAKAKKLGEAWTAKIEQDTQSLIEQHHQQEKRYREIMAQ